MRFPLFTAFTTLCIICLIPLSSFSQSNSGFGSGRVSKVQWSKDGRFLIFRSDGKLYQFDLQTLEKKVVKKDEVPESVNSWRGKTRGAAAANSGRQLGRPTRGRQHTGVVSPDGKWTARYKNWNVVLEKNDSKDVVQVTTKGNEKIHYGTASWVYGEELNQTTAMWWTPDSKKLIYYRFDDTNVQKFYLIRGWSEINTRLYPEYYPKAGATNPGASMYVYDLASKKSIRVGAGGTGDEYIYNVRFSPNGDVMMLNWTDRLQHHLKVLAVDLQTGNCRTIVEEKQKTWQRNSPRMFFLKNKSQFLWPTDKSGYTHYELRDLNGKLHRTITRGNFQILRYFVDEEKNMMAFTAGSSVKNPYYHQFHMVDLDGNNQRRVTSLDYHHSNFQLSPDHQWLVAQYEEPNKPPCTALYRTRDGKMVASLAVSDPKSAANVAEVFSFRSNDGKHDIYGILYKPIGFDPKKKYPVINALYGGPGSMEFSSRYVSRPPSQCNRGYLVVKVNNRGTGGRGKAFLSAAYQRLGDVDIQDHADAIRLLRKRPYVDGERVGIVGHSYGGYMAAMGIFKHPDVYAASVNRAGVTTWKNYDTIYTERYMSTPQLNPTGYKVGAPMTYVKDFKGKILIMHGMLDDNVHPNNAFQLIEAMDRANKPYESRFWPNAGHGLGRGAGTSQREFFDRILKPGT